MWIHKQRCLNKNALNILTFSSWRLFHVGGSPLATAILQSLPSRMLTSANPFFFISLPMVSMYLTFGLPLGIAPSTTMSSTDLVVWLSSLRLTCPYQRSRYCIRCVAIGWTVAASLISSFLLCSLRLTPCIHRNIVISVLFISISSFFVYCPAFSPICHSMFYNSLIDVMFELDGYFLITDESSYFYPFIPG